MKTSSTQELVVGLGLVALLLVLINPMHIFMPTRLTMVLVGGMTILVLLFASLIWREGSEDEREEHHRLLASRAGYLAGVAVLLVGLLVQTRADGMDVWVALALGAMVLAKLMASAYNRKHR